MKLTISWETYRRFHASDKDDTCHDHDKLQTSYPLRLAIFVDPKPRKVGKSPWIDEPCYWLDSLTDTRIVKKQTNGSKTIGMPVR